MKISDINFESIGINLEKVPDPAREAIIRLFNLVEEVSAENKKLREDILRLNTEIAHLKGEQGKPDIKGKQQADISSETERRQTKKRKKKRSKKGILHITKQVVLPVDKSTLPKDAVYKGTEIHVIQDLLITTEVIAFKKEVYYSPSERKTYTGKLPAGYRGEFGPRIKALIILCKTVGNMAEPKIVDLVRSLGIMITKSSIDRILLRNKEPFHLEKEEIFLAGRTSSRAHHIDTTGARVNGENFFTHVLCNKLYSAYFTRKKKDRLTLLDILQSGSTQKYLYSYETESLFLQLRVSDVTLKKLAGIPRNKLLTEEEITAFLPGNLGKLQKQKCLEAMAITGYLRTPERPHVQILIADNAPEFKFLADELGLCWVHEGRPYKKLQPVIPRHRDLLKTFLGRYWKFYHKLLEYKKRPSEKEANSLRDDFYELFSTCTDYHKLNDRIAKTKAKGKELLLVLKYPEISLHNNPAELAARQQVRKRDVSLQTKTEEGTRVQDTFLTIIETAKKLKVNIYEYIFDRVSKTYALPSLAALIRKATLYNSSLIRSP